MTEARSSWPLQHSWGSYSLVDLVWLQVVSRALQHPMLHLRYALITCVSWLPIFYVILKPKNPSVTSLNCLIIRFDLPKAFFPWTWSLTQEFWLSIVKIVITQPHSISNRLIFVLIWIQCSTWLIGYNFLLWALSALNFGHWYIVVVTRWLFNS